MSTTKHCTICGYENSDPKARFCAGCGQPLKVRVEFYDAFLSYRRDGGIYLADSIRTSLTATHSLNVFLDAELDQGRFDEEILARIASAPAFILILSPGCLDRCKNEGDWVRREIVHALQLKKRIIPVKAEGFTFPKAVIALNRL